jgi:membrane-bound lytic murein transglycosylase D
VAHFGRFSPARLNHEFIEERMNLDPSATQTIKDDTMYKTLSTIVIICLLPACQTLSPAYAQISNGGQTTASTPESSHVPQSHTESLPIAQDEVELDSLDPLADFLITSSKDRKSRAILPALDLWERIRQGFAMPPLDTPLAEQFARRFATTNYLSRTEARSQRYLYYIVQELEKRGMPTELALLPFVESSLNPHATSPVGATGTWQFMPGTGRQYDLRISYLVDDRKNVMQATRAALDYLQKLHNQFGDWHLALASYNWGEGRVQTAVERNRAQGLPVDYLSIRMPTETRNYVPQLEALRRIIAEPEKYGVNLPLIPNAPYFKEIRIHHDLDLATAVRYTGLSESDFLALNPSVKRPLIMAAATPILLLPQDAAQRLREQLDKYGSRASWSVVKLDSTQRVEHFAAQHGVAANTVRQVNGIPARMKPQAGSTLLVPVAAGNERRVSEQAVEYASLALTPDVVRVQFQTRKGETLASVAKRLALDPVRLREWNSSISTKRKQPAGQTLVAIVYPEDAERIQKLSRNRADERKTPARSVVAVAKMKPGKIAATSKGKTVLSAKRSGKKS